MFFDYKPINPSLFFREKTEDDILIEGIVAGLKASGLQGEDISFMVVQTLKQLGRDDLLSSCERS